MKKLNSILIIDKVQNKAEFGLYNNRSLSYLSLRLNLYIPFIYYDNFNYRKGNYLVFINNKKLIELKKIHEKSK